MQTTFPEITLRETHLGEIRNLYWHLRAIRPFQGARRRKLYRQIAKHKAALIADGFNPELLRLYCRQFSNCHTEAARARYEAFLQKNENISEKTPAA